jgi:hypothetical protein
LLPHRTRAALNVRRGVLDVRNNYREDVIKNKRGYIMEWDYKRNTRIPQHRLVMETAVKRKLHDEERVHHINGKKDDNRIENLYRCEDASEHKNIHDSMNNLVYKMVEDEIVMFDKGTGTYKLNT